MIRWKAIAKTKPPSKVKTQQPTLQRVDGTAARAPTAFERRCYALCSSIPAGSVATYGSLAKALVPPSAARAVGQAMKRNPFAPTVPCHRVIAADRGLGGFAGEGFGEGPAVLRKRRLLEGEGVAFDADGRVSEACVMAEL